jgi:glutamine amidotransferase
LPGVGAFGDGMANLKKFGLVDILRKEVLEQKKPFLGICLGMQMLADIGMEGGNHNGLGWIAGISRKLEGDQVPLRLPHVGWNDVSVSKNSILFGGVKRPIFYFVHSYHIVPKDVSIISGYCRYGEKFAAAIEKDNIFGVQFHPEKSQDDGLKVLDNFLQYNA